ncbi:uncharacterized protein LOC131218182 [Magnolia sinica]|uniref:uncharacterized protein LOC131218182 n=1 Tax=Magnolia sinica TaxID=86752 RepID=UPI00265A8A5B|nr:uncharacterized protein LOC131218182 [Magnolia sinica]
MELRINLILRLSSSLPLVSLSPSLLSPFRTISSLALQIRSEDREKKSDRMGRGVSSGGGQSSLGYLFGSGEAPKPSPNHAEPAQNPPPPPAAAAVAATTNIGSAQKPAAAQPVDNAKQIPAGIHGNPANNYFRADGQNSGNFITVCEYIRDDYAIFFDQLCTSQFTPTAYWSCNLDVLHGCEGADILARKVIFACPYNYL